ncbi:efflux RND transporter periplasmic adaptor subunit [Paenibacillus illinoisensis]|uniref:Multidrug resistance efflux pump n=1 Tax=Paenibacillus illinoisensis TaxID=59845 RepID=A0A2W0C5R3_9BACL|nr:efflux RND transporter periplasmic adaptor subunit [Paenibacillus illinoisensis]PYY27993.1 Multidrug resistance efflux pump [Paenibacillus illinoisensis]
MNSRAILINIIVILVILGAGAAGIYYYNQSTSYVKTDNALVTGQPISIASTVSGELQTWKGKVGTSYNQGDTIGTVSAGGKSTPITMPVAGTVVQATAVENSLVSAGNPLARAYDFNNLYVTANVEETVIDKIKSGQIVDVYIDAFPDTTLTGKVDQIGLATASSFSLLPSTNTNANYTKVTQVIPITITIEGYKGLGVVPGMSATVRVHI